MSHQDDSHIDFHNSEPEVVLPDRDRFLKRFVGENALDYLETFRRFHRAGRNHFLITWHWPAFLFPFLWSLYRKLWGWSIVIFLVGIVLWPFSNLVWAISANYLYFLRAQRAVRRAKRKDLDEEETLQWLVKRGGVSNEALMLAILIVLLLFTGAYWKLKLTPVFTELSDNLEQIEKVQ